MNTDVEKLQENLKSSIELLDTAKNEIRNLRRHNELMSARLDTFDKMMVMFNTQPAHSGYGMSPDVTYEIEKFITGLKLEENKVVKS